MRIAIMGFPQSGKTTLFNVLARAHARTGAFAGGGGGMNIGTVQVPDGRLEKLRDMFQPRKYTPAQVEYVDLAGLAPAERQKESLYPPQLTSSELVVCAIRAFTDLSVPHPFGSLDPERDVRRFGEEMILKDLGIVENRLARLEKSARVGAGKEEAREVDLLKRCRDALEAETPLRDLDFDPDARRRLKGFQFLTAKPLLTVFNVDEGDIPGGHPAFRKLAEIPRPPNTAMVQVAARTEMELAGLAGEERAEFMALLGIEESSLSLLIRVSYDLLGLCSFFTVGPDEVRAWTIEKGSRAVDAAGVIHSDLARGFIRAEVARWDELLEAGSYGDLRDRGRLKVEGREYPVQDGDVLNIRFSV